jgi:hypothetical protein
MTASAPASPTTETAPAAPAETAPSADAAPAKKKAAPNPIKSIERMIAKAIKLTEEGSGTDEEKASFITAWKGPRSSACSRPDPRTRSR